MSKVIDLNEHRKKKQEENDLTRGRKPLYVSHLKGTATGDKTDDQNLGDRISRIKNSLERINKLMKMLKDQSELDKRR